MENIKEFIRTAKTRDMSDEFRSLIDDFESLASLQESKEAGGGTLDFARKFEEAQVKFWSSLEKVLPTFGLTPEQVADYFNDPNRFSVDDLEKFRAFKQS